MRASHQPSWSDNWARYLRWCSGATRWFPELYEAGLLLCRPEPAARWWHRQGHYLRRLIHFILDVGTAPRPQWRAEFVVCYHSKSESVRVPFHELAERLSYQERNVLLCGPQEAWLFVQGEKMEVSSAFARALTEAPGFYARGVCIVRAGAATLWLSFRAALGGDGVTAGDLGRTWYELTRSASRRLLATNLLGSLKARVLLVSHERFAPGACFVTARWKGRRLLYCHGTPSGFETPVLSQTILAWNKTCAHMWRDLVGKSSTILTVGNTEVEQILSKSKVRNLGSRRVLLFLSECTPTDEYRRETSTRHALQWLSSASLQLPGWEFWIKERAYHDTISVLFHSQGLSLLPAFRLVLASESFHSLIMAPEVWAVAAFSSSGLYVASAVGKPALRLLVPGADAPIAVLDEVTTPISSPQKLFQWLAAEAVATEPTLSCMPDSSWRGALGRIETCCLAPLLSPASASP